jgi:hypothetical protein
MPAYDLEEGQVLVVDPDAGSGILYVSREEVARLRAEFDRPAPARRRADTTAVLPRADEFLRDVDTLAASLVRRFDAARLDFTVESVDRLDRAMKAIRGAARRSPGFVAALTAYLGEVVRYEVGGRWDASEEPEAEPVVVLPNGATFRPARLVVRRIFAGTGPLFGSLSGAMGAWRATGR